MPDLANDPRFKNKAERARHSSALVAILDDVFAARNYTDWRRVLATLRGLWAPVQTPAEIHEDPQAIGNGLIADVDYPDGPLSLVSPPVMFDGAATKAAPAPDFGEHTDEVLATVGYDADAVARMRAAGIVG